jgi:hypothetical protein
VTIQARETKSRFPAPPTYGNALDQQVSTYCYGWGRWHLDLIDLNQSPPVTRESWARVAVQKPTK